MTVELESRYRLLLRLFPHQHRARFLEEMVSTLMDGATPRQRLPRGREVVDLLWNAIRLRFTRSALPGRADSRWSDAAAIVGLVGAFVLHAAATTRPMLGMFFRDPLPWGDFVHGAAWLAVGVLALFGVRRTAAGLAWLITLAHLVYRLAGYLDNPPLLTRNWGLVVLGVTVAACLSLPAGKHRARRLLGDPLTIAIAASLVAFGATVHLDGQQSPGGLYLLPFLFGEPLRPASLIVALVNLCLIGWACLRPRDGVSRRILALAAPTLIMVPLMRAGYEGFEGSSMRFWPTPVLLTVPQWLIMVLLPPVIFAVCVALVRRTDRYQELIRLGREELARRASQPPGGQSPSDPA